MILQYRTYWNKNATDKDVIRWSHYGVIFFALLASAFSTMLHYVGVDLGWTLYMLGVLTCPGIFPTVFTILWKRQSKAAAIISPLLGMATGIAVWLGSAYALYGTITIVTTGATVPCVWGTVASAISPLPYSVIITLFKPESFDWAEFQKESLAFKIETTSIGDKHNSSVQGTDIEAIPELNGEDSQQQLKRWGRIAAIWAAVTFLGHWVLWPLPMYASKYIFGETFFTAWLVVAIVWLWGTLIIVGFYPIVDGRHQLLEVWRSIRAGVHTKTKRDGSTHDSSESGEGTPNIVESKVDY
jgi:hypothetical protein